jgi:hypothetical protein
MLFPSFSFWCPLFTISWYQTKTISCWIGNTVNWDSYKQIMRFLSK